MRLISVSSGVLVLIASGEPRCPGVTSEVDITVSSPGNFNIDTLGQLDP